ncbi:T9SS type A sorting domain-containing protein [uncultured Polaribacter sp.]|uniref:T9SS type A sorting domain-containing protein n=1 Tax=uncultured Polaribacter sp. TaxID=174711 RepID=UPI0026381D3E|nr:T9SS type A sorting domain-containing protein [uncultured Polaribacter sp.]
MNRILFSKKIRCLYLILFCLAISNFSYAQCIEENIGTGTKDFTRSGEAVGQSFTASCTGSLLTIGFDFYSNATVDFLIYEGAGNTGILLGSKLNYVINNAVAGKIENIDIRSLNINLTNEQLYTVYFRPIAGTSIDYSFFTSSPYPKGNIFFNNTRASSWETGFSFFATPTIVENPSCIVQNLATGTGTFTRHKEFRGQSFTADCTGVLTTIGIDFSSDETVDFLIYDGAGNTGALLGFKLNQIISNANSGDIETVDINDLNINVIQGQQYTVYFDPSSAGGEIDFAFLTSSSYAGGALYLGNTASPYETRFSFLITPLVTETVSIENLTPDGSGTVLSSTNLIGQSFIPILGGKLQSVGFDFATKNSINNLEVKIYSGGGIGTLIGTLSNQSITFSTSGSIEYINVSSLNINIVVGQEYTVLLSTTDSGISTFNNSGNPYSAGSFFVNNTRFSDRDMRFSFKIGRPSTNNRFNNTSSDNKWSTIANWSAGLPTSTDNIIINKDIIIDVEDISLRNLTLNYGANLNIPVDKEITVNNDFVSFGEVNIASDATNSGVLLVKRSSKGEITYNRGGLLANKWSVVTPPISDQKILSFAQNTAVNNIRSNTTVSPVRYAIGSYDDNLSNKWQYFDANTPVTEEFVAGTGYSMSRGSDGAVSFKGSLNTVSIFSALPANKWSLIGNPFTAYIPANENGSSSFLGDNINSLDDNFKSIYMWDNAQNKYVAVTQVDGVNRFLTPGQGFFVRMKTGETNIVFYENKRQAKPVAGTTTFQKSASTIPNIKLFIDNGTVKVSTDIKYFNNATKGFDPGYDIGNFNGSDLDIFTHLVEDNKNVNYTIQSLPTSNIESMVIPVGIISKEGDISFSIDATDLPIEYKVFLEDKENNTFNQLNEVNSKYDVSFATDTNTTDRFFLHTTNAKALSLNDDMLNGVSIYKTSNNDLKISGLLNENVNLSVYNILGKEVFTKRFQGKTTNTIPLPIRTAGVYIVCIQTENGKLSKKIILE